MVSKYIVGASSIAKYHTRLLVNTYRTRRLRFNKNRFMSFEIIRNYGKYSGKDRENKRNDSRYVRASLPPRAYK